MCNQRRYHRHKLRGWRTLYQRDFRVHSFTPLEVRLPNANSVQTLIDGRNLGILIAFVIFGGATYLTATEFISAKRSKGEVLLFRRGQVPSLSTPADEEGKSAERVTSYELTREVTVPAAIQKQTAVFHWDGVNYDIKIKGQPRKLLDDVDGWVKPGTLTALMVCCRSV